MEHRPPARRHVQINHADICGGKRIKWFLLCIIIVGFVTILQLSDVSNLFSFRNVPGVFVASALDSNTTVSKLTLTKTNQYLPNINEIKRPVVNENLDDFRKTHFMTVHGNGRLGNQMFEVAALIGTACRHNYTPFVKRNHKITRLFDLKQVMDIIMTNKATVVESRAGAYNSQVETLSHDKNWTLNGYFQSWKYFHHCRDKVIQSFQFRADIKKKALEVLKTINAKGRPLVGVHVRRSDMASPREMRRGYNVATPSYMNKALTYFRNNTNNPLFVVVSDDRHWTTTNTKGPDVVYAGTGSAETDLALLSLCNHTIITSGSFGWWGAYLNKGTTVYFSNFPSHGSWLAKQYQPEDYYPTEWIGME